VFVYTNKLCHICNVKLEDLETLFLTDGKFFVVVAVLVAIFIGIVIYLVNMDRKLKEIENKN